MVTCTRLPSESFSRFAAIERSRGLLASKNRIRSRYCLKSCVRSFRGNPTGTRNRRVGVIDANEVVICLGLLAEHMD